MTAAVSTPKRLVDRTCGELRELARARREPARSNARRELARRRDNLRGAVVPGWELAARGPVAMWELW